MLPRCFTPARGRTPSVEGGNELATDADPVSHPQLGVDPRRAIHPPVFGVDLPDLLDQPRV